MQYKAKNTNKIVAILTLYKMSQVCLVSKLIYIDLD
jgi:hypothetical protein